MDSEADPPHGGPDGSDHVHAIVDTDRDVVVADERQRAHEDDRGAREHEVVGGGLEVAEAREGDPDDAHRQSDERHHDNGCTHAVR